MNAGTINSVGSGVPLTPAAVKKAEAASGAETADTSLVRERAALTQFSGDSWNPSGETEFSMSTYTKNGTMVQVVAGNSGFTMGNFQGMGQTSNNFQLAGARDDLNMQVLFTTRDGDTRAFKLTESSTFHETEDGQIEEGKGRRNVVKDPDNPDTMRDENSIVINLDDETAVQGGTGDDLLLNFGAKARISGNDGDDSIISMGDKVRLDGGAGDDLIKIVEDQIRAPKESTIDLSAVSYNGSSRNLGSNMLGSGQGGLMDLLPTALVGKDKGTEATIVGGDGNDVIDGRNAKLEQADVQGNAGDDTMMLDVIAASTVKGGDGDDTIHVNNSLMSTIDGGDGNDEITLDKGKDTNILGGKGDDTIITNFTVGGTIQGGDGNDTIKAFKTVDTLINGGNGDDNISVGYMYGGEVSGGNGNDTIAVKQVVEGLISGGGGGDAIAVGKAHRAVITGGVGNDSIDVIVAENSLISGDDGDDLIRTGLGARNIIDGGAGNDSIGTNQLRTAGMLHGAEQYEFSDEEVEKTALELKQMINADGQNGLTLSKDLWMNMAREALQNAAVLKDAVGSSAQDIIIDDGAVQSGPENLSEALNKRLDNLNTGGMRLSTEQKQGLKTYMDSLRKLVE